MPRNLSFNYPIHITARSHNREKFPVNLTEVWKLYEDYLYYLHLVYKIEINLFVLMPNHFHLICSAPDSNLSPAMNYFMRETSRWMSRKAKRINQVYGAPFFSSEIGSYLYYEHAYKYCYRNPVKAGLATECESWKYSTLSGLLGFSKLIIPLQTDTILFNPDFDPSELAWLNRAPEALNEESVKRALRKKIFRLKKDNSKKIPNVLEKFRL